MRRQTRPARPAGQTSGQRRGTRLPVEPTLRGRRPAPAAPKPGVIPTGPAHPAALEAALAAGRGYRDLGDFERAAERFGAALALARASGDVQAETDALNLQAGLASTLGNYPGALASFERALALAEGLALPDRQANILNNIGTLHTLLGNYPLALEKLKAAHDLLRRVAPGTRSAASNLISLGTLYQELGDDAEARAFFVQAGKVAAAADEPLMAAAALNNLANTDLGVGNWRSAAEHFGRAPEITRRVGAREHKLDNLDGLGQVYVEMGDFRRAETTHLDVLRAARALEVLHTGLSLTERTERQPLAHP